MTDAPDPLTAPCTLRSCRAPAGKPCLTNGHHFRPQHPTRPHKRRAHLALKLAAHADPALDGHFFYGSPTCGLCGTPGLPQRHRVVDAVAGHLEAGEDEDVIAEELEVSEEAVGVVRNWMQRWDGAWR